MAGTSSHVGLGSTCAAVGTGAIALGVFKPPFLAQSFLDTPAWALSIVGGCVLGLAGAIIILFTMRKEEEPAPEIPAHVAFNKKMVAPDIVPHAPTTRAPAAAPPAPRLPTPAQPAQQRVAPPRTDILQIDGQIRELTKKINKAGVMLATGQLSQQGYLVYVEDLKRQRGRLEAQRVKEELRT